MMMVGRYFATHEGRTLPEVTAISQASVVRLLFGSILTPVPEMAMGLYLRTEVFELSSFASAIAEPMGIAPRAALSVRRSKPLSEVSIFVMAVATLPSSARMKSPTLN